VCVRACVRVCVCVLGENIEDTAAEAGVGRVGWVAVVMVAMVEGTLEFLVKPGTLPSNNQTQ
jgi:hypothetical protein